MVAQQERGVGTFLEHDEHTAVDHHVHTAAQEVEHLQRTLHALVLRHIDKKSVLCEGCVEQSRTRSGRVVVFSH